MKKILFVTPGCFDKGGISRYSRYQINALRGIFGRENVAVLSLWAPDEYSFEEPFEVDWYGTSSSFTLNKIKLLLKILQLTVTWKPNFILSAHVNFSGYTYLISHIFRKKSILNIYGLEIWSGLKAISRFGLRKTDYIISDCFSTKDHAIKNNLVTKDNITVIWDCVDSKKFKPLDGPQSNFSKKYDLPSKSNLFIILSFGRLSKGSKHKGFERLIYVFRDVLKSVPNARLVIAGGGNMKDYYISKCRTLGLQEYVSFPGRIHENDLSEMYNYADIFSLVSDKGLGRGEGIPLTPLEAMSCATPIIVGNQDGSKESVFSTHKNGFVIDPDDLEKHASILITLSQNKKELQVLSDNALLTSKLYFNYEEFKKKLELFFNSLDEE